MLTPSRRFLAFHAVFWLIAGLGLFVSGLSQMPWRAALARNVFLPVAGFLTSFALLPLIESQRTRGGLALRALAFSAAYGVAVFCVVAINAVTFTQQGTRLAELGLGQWTSGAMNFFLVLAFWTELTIQRIWSRDARHQPRGGDGRELVLTDRGKVRPVPVGDITHVTAAGDYVRIHLRSDDRPAVERRTLSSLLEHLPASTFLRVHRSAIVNCDRVASLEALAKGRCRLTLDSGEVVESSRGYRDAVRARFQAAPR